MPDTYTCPWHNVTLSKTTYCEQCQKDFEERRDAKTMTVEERAVALEKMIENSILSMPFGQIHQRIEELVGRPVWTHELATPKMLVCEIRSDNKATIGDVLDKMPDDKKCIVVVTDTQPPPDGDGEGVTD